MTTKYKNIKKDDSPFPSYRITLKKDGRYVNRTGFVKLKDARQALADYLGIDIDDLPLNERCSMSYEQAERYLSKPTPELRRSKKCKPRILKVVRK